MAKNKRPYSSPSTPTFKTTQVEKVQVPPPSPTRVATGPYAPKPPPSHHTGPPTPGRPHLAEGDNLYPGGDDPSADANPTSDDNYPTQAITGDQKQSVV
jgi:hypothetical protein